MVLTGNSLAIQWLGGFPGGVSGKEPTCQRGLDPWVGKILWRRTWQPTPVFFQENSIDRGARYVTVRGITKSQTRQNTHIHTNYLQDKVVNGNEKKKNNLTN